MKHKICFTTDSEQIIRIWNRVFGDDEAYIRFFLEHCRHKQCLGLFAADKLVSMLFLIECAYDGMQGAYIYAVATDPAYRKQGFMRNLLDYSKHLDYDFLCLVPAEPYLFDVYAKFGFEAKLYGFEHKAVNGNAGNADFETYFSHRNHFLHMPFVRICDEAYLYHENLYCGGSFFVGEDFIAAFRDGEMCEYISASENRFSHPVGMLYSKKELRDGYFGLYMD